jgi:hypothetical protein
MYIWDCARSPARPPVRPRHSFRVRPLPKPNDEAFRSRPHVRTLNAEAEHRNRLPGEQTSDVDERDVEKPTSKALAHAVIA